MDELLEEVAKGGPFDVAEAVRAIAKYLVAKEASRGGVAKATTHAEDTEAVAALKVGKGSTARK